MVRFDNSEAHDDQEIETLTRDISRLFQESEWALSKISLNPRTCGLVSATESHIRRNVQRSNAATLQRLSKDFRSRQQQYLDRLLSHEPQRYDSAFDFLLTEKNNNNQEEEGEGDIMSVVERANITTFVDERAREMARISNSVAELAQVFQEVGNLVLNQGSIVDRIDYNLEQVTAKMRFGVKELRTAERYQKSPRASRCIAVLCGAILVCGTILVNRHS